MNQMLLISHRANRKSCFRVYVMHACVRAWCLSAGEMVQIITNQTQHDCASSAPAPLIPPRLTEIKAQHEGSIAEHALDAELMVGY